MNNIIDPHTQSNFNDVSTKHLYLDLEVDFDSKVLKGKAVHLIKNNSNTDQFILDTNGLEIKRVTLDEEEFKTSFSIGNEVKYLGKSLIINIKQHTKTVTIYYSTTANSKALQWLSPDQTSGKENPFLFTQSQAILARSWIPCQDTPAIKFTYSAMIKTPKELLPLMSARNPVKLNEDGIYKFEMPQKIPSYLMALCAGVLNYKKVSSRTGVYAEPGIVESAHNEFIKLEDMLHSAEALYGKYLWEQFDVIVLPPGFPFGGMENPRLTFATPTVITGDRSLTSLIAHELAHSWSGNLVTNASWNDFWLNEGFTVYFERRIMERLEGKEYSDMLAQLGYNDLLETLSELKDNMSDTALKLHLENRDPDEGMTNIAYEKGYFMLLMIENIVGREIWDKFLIKYFKNFSFKSITTEKFIDIFKSEIEQLNIKQFDKINLVEWIYKEGIPDNCPPIKSKRFAKVEKNVNLWINGTKAKDLITKDWSSHEWLYFLKMLPKKISKSQIKELDLEFNFTSTNNSEIFTAWALIAINNDYSQADNSIENFLMNVGRRKFLLPLYKALLKNERTNKLAKDIYKKARSGYHYVSTASLDKIIN